MDAQAYGPATKHHPETSSGLIVQHVSLRNFRSYHALELALSEGLVVVVGPNGVGKTNLLEALHVGSQGFSPRTRAETRLVCFGESVARVSLAGHEGGAAVRTEVRIEPRVPKRLLLNGASVESADELRSRLAALAFLPERLVVVKGGPVVRRTYFDRMLGRVFPSRATLATDYGRALAQRNESLRRVRTGAGSREAVAPWTVQVSVLGTELDAARAELVGLLAPRFAEAAAALGLSEATLRYEARLLESSELQDRLERDIERGLTGAGPHLRDIELIAAARELRGFGSQGEQRTAVLALILAEAGLLRERSGSPPLLLLDDVLSELDQSRRRALLDCLPEGGQAVITTTGLEALPATTQPALVVRVSPGEAVVA